MDQSYDFGGAGAGRNVTADTGPVNVTLPNGTGTLTSVAVQVNVTGGSGVGLLGANTVAANPYSVIECANNTTATNSAAILGIGTAGSPGIVGEMEATGTSFSAVFGNNLRTTGGVGVSGVGFQGTSGESARTGGSGVYGLHTQPTLGINVGAGIVNPGVTALGYYGVLGQTAQPAGSGVYGLNTAADDGVNDIAGVTGNGGFAGVVGNSDPGNYGVASLTSILALVDLASVGTKTFIIDHPLDPANKYLKHFAMESNEVLNVYRGNVVLNSEGKAIVTMPDYFDGININFSYNLTAVGAPAPGIYVSKEMANGTFEISGGVAGGKISWQVTAERNDLYMQRYPESKNAEPSKPANRHGRYLRPELYGQPDSQRLFNSPILDKQVELKEAGKSTETKKLSATKR